ncbi:MAG: hypothetical protein PVSMB7_17160 [Chloroflexota bacterium]
MKRFKNSQELGQFERRLAQWGHQAPIDPHHKAHLRDELLRRHQELTVRDTQRPARRLWPRFSGLKRLTLVASPALAIVVVVFVMLSGLQISGHRSTQQAEAARLSLALAHTVPTVTSWQVSVQQSHGSAVQWYRCSAPLQNRHLYIRGTDLFIYTDRWYQVTPASVAGTGCPAAWQWAFSALAGDAKPPVYPGGRIGSHVTERIVYPARHSKGLTMHVTAWVDHVTGLVLRLETTVTRGTRIVEQDRVDYTYGLQTKK